jgi:hypothetical protein
MRRDFEHNPHKYLSSNTPGSVQVSASHDPQWKTSLNLFLQLECRVSLHPLGGAEHKTTSFPTHAVSVYCVYTICILFLFFSTDFSDWSWLLIRISNRRCCLKRQTKQASVEVRLKRFNSTAIEFNVDFNHYSRTLTVFCVQEFAVERAYLIRKETLQVCSRLSNLNRAQL